MAVEFASTDLDLQGLGPGDAIALKARVSEAAFLMIKNAASDILLLISLHPDSGEFIVTRRIADVWRDRTVQALKAAVGEAVDIRIDFEDAGANVRVGTAPPVVFPTSASLKDPAKLQGDMQVAEVQVAWSQAAKDAARRRVVSALPPAPGRQGSTTVRKDLIYDIGMHNGKDTGFYLAKGFRVAAVEANPQLCRQGARLFSEAVDQDRLTILNIGVGESRGSFPFYINTVLDHWSSFDREIASRDYPVETQTVDVYTIRDVFDAYGVPYFLKVDIEGYDQHVINQLPGLKTLPTYVSAENGAPDMFEAMVKAGYAEFQFVNQRDVPQVKLRADGSGPVEGRSIDFSFEHGSSGPFGADLVGEWLSVSAMRDKLTEHFAHWGEDDAWYDLHARLPGATELDASR